MHVHFTALQREKHIAAAAIAGDDAVGNPKRLQGQMSQDAGDVGCAIGADDEFLRLHDVRGLLHAARHDIGAHVVDANVADAAEELELVIAGAQSLVAERLGERVPQGEHDGLPVRIGPLVNIIECKHASGAGHVLHDDIGLSRQVLAQIRRKGSNERIGRAARAKADHDRQRLAGVEVLRERALGGEQPDCAERRADEIPFPHVPSPFLIFQAGKNALPD